MNRYFSISGRDSRTRYLLATLAAVAMWAVVVLVAALGLGSSFNAFFGIVAVLLASLVAIWLGFTAMVRRLHDLGYSGWWTLGIAALGAFCNAAINAGANDVAAVLLFLVGAAPYLYLFFAPGEPEINRFGPPAGGTT